MALRTFIAIAHIMTACISGEILSTGKILQLSLNPQNRFPVSIEDTFSSDSDVTVVLTSCNRLPQLEVAINSFFHYNTLVIKEFIIIEDCQPSNQQKIWALLPTAAKEHEEYFTVIINKKRQGQMGAIDTAYSMVNTKYVYHMEDDWVQIGTYGLLERLYDALTHAQGSGMHISQVVTTFPRWGWSHMPGQLQKSSNGTIYYKLKSYGKDWLYSFSFNPHLINYDKIYKGLLKGSIINSIAHRYHCTNDQETVFLEDGGCVEQYLGRFLAQQGYNQIYVQNSEQLVYEHTGTPDFKASPLQLDQLFARKTQQNTPISTQQGQQNADAIQQENEQQVVSPPAFNKQNVKELIRKVEDLAHILLMLVLFIVIMVTIITGKCVGMIRAYEDPKAGMEEIDSDENTETSSSRIS